MNFASDNWAGASDPVIAALAEVARRGGPAYGGDEITKAVEVRFAELFEHEVAVFLVGSGTAANALGLSAFARPGGVVLCHEHAHIVVDEAGAASFFGGGITLAGLKGDVGKLTAKAVAAAIEARREHVPHSGQPIALSLTQLTELGTAYRPREIQDLAAVARANACAVHMDGARFANAVVSLGVPPADITWKAGIDVLSFGGTKNGCLAAEALIFFDPSQAKDLAFQRQRAGQGYSKNWFIAAQLDAYLRDDHWLELARHANAMARRLADAIVASPDARLAVEPDGNELFVVISKDANDRLRAAGAIFYPWAADKLPEATSPMNDEITIRLIASWQTQPSEIERFAATLAG